MKRLKMLWMFLTIPEATELMSAGFALHKAALAGVRSEGTIAITYNDGSVRKMEYTIAPSNAEVSRGPSGPSA